MDKIILLGILLSGGDHLSIKLLGLTFKLSQLIFLVYTILLITMRKYKLSKVFLGIYLFIFLPHLFSLFYSKDLNGSWAYFIFIIFNLLIVINPVMSWVREKKNNSYVMDNYFNIFKIVGFLTIIQFILGSFKVYIPIFQNDVYRGIFRPSLWFYEPSYLATYFSLYLGMSLIGFLFDKKKYKKDLLLSWIFIAFTTSSTGYISIILSIIFYVIFEKSYKKLYKNILFILNYIFILVITLFILKKDILIVFLGRLFKNGLSSSSGNRAKGISEAIQVFKEFPIFGIGANAFEKYHYTEIPVTNVTLEILTNLGLVGFLSFFLFILYLYYIYKKNDSILEVKMLGFSLFFFLIMLQANQNYMRMYMWIHIAIFISTIEVNKIVSFRLKERENYGCFHNNN